MKRPRELPLVKVSADALDDDFSPRISTVKTAKPSSGAPAPPPVDGVKQHPLSKRQARKARSKARAAGITDAIAGAGAPAADGAKAEAGLLVPWAPPHALAEGLWSLFRASIVGGSTSELEYTSPLASASVANYSSSLRGATSSIIRAVLSRVAREKAALIRGVDGSAAPALLVVTHSAPRAAQILRDLAPFKTRIGKVFLKDSIDSLRSGPNTALAVGTPRRIHDAIADGALSLENCSVIVLDAVPDLKRLCILTEKGAKEEWWALYLRFVHASARQGLIKITLLT